jgi:hypothetical protein
MKNNQKNKIENNDAKVQNIKDQLPGTENDAQNPNPRANENIRVRTEDPKSQNSNETSGVGSEITDGEDA